MPKSKRSRLVTLANTEKKGKENKIRIFDEVRSALDEFNFVWILQLDDIRTPILQDIRGDFIGSKLILGKRRVLEKALGESIENEYKENLHKLSELCVGVTGLLFTNESVETVRAYFDAYTKQDYSRAKSISPIDFIIPAGVVYSTGGMSAIEDDVPMPHSVEETLRSKLKVPTRIKGGKIILDEPYVVCHKGDILDVRQALLLKQFGVAASDFKVKTIAYYDKTNSDVVKI